MRRRGLIIVEVLAACGLLAILLALCVKLLAMTSLERRLLERRSIALQEVANQVERVSAIPFDELSGDKLDQLQLSQDVAHILPNAKLSFNVTDVPGEIPGKRVGVEIEWQGHGARAERPVRLDYWAFGTLPAEPKPEPESEPKAETESGPPASSTEEPDDDAPTEAAP